MTHEKINKNEISKAAKQLIKQGASRQRAFDILVEKYKYTRDVSEVIKHLPSSEAIKKYGLWNYVLLGILILITGLFMLAYFSPGYLLWNGLLMYVVARMLVKYYILVSVLSGIGILGSIAGLATNDNITWSNMLIFFLLIIPACILPIWLKKKLCPPPSEKKVKYTNSEGQLRVKIVYEFKDM